MKKITRATKQKRYNADKRRYYNRLKLQRNNKHNVVFHDDGVDRISLLPDEILASVLSRLPLKTAIATSILSTRWRHLYTKMTSLLIPTTKLSKNQDDFSKFVDTINHTLDLFKSNSALKEFGLSMHHCFQGADLEKWLGFALARKVETINIFMCYDTNSLHYTPPLSLIRGGTHLPGLKTLKQLCLMGIKVADSEIEFLLSSFPLLEVLFIRESERLKNVSVVGGGRELKRLSMCALYLESIVIRDVPNLVALVYYGYGEYTLRLANVPKLTELHVSENGVNLLHTIPSSVRGQLRLLEICANPTLLTIDQPSYELKNIKQLDIKVHMILCYSNHQLQKLYPLIEACTSLESLDVKLIWMEEGEEKREIEEVVVHTRKQLSPSLKRFAVSGYTGSAEELEFALFIMNKAAALEQMTVEPCGDHPTTKKRTAIARARKDLKPVAPSSLNLVIKNISKRSKH